MTLEKGAMVFHMLRWEVGDENFKKILRGVLSQYAGKPMRTADLIKVAERAIRGEPLTPFFAQWLDGTGAPLFTNKYTVYRLGNNKGFRTIGEIDQDLDLFSMPVELRVETDGKTEIQACGRCRHRLAIRRRYLRASASHHHRSAQLGAQEFT